MNDEIAFQCSFSLKQNNTGRGHNFCLQKSLTGLAGLVYLRLLLYMKNFLLKDERHGKLHLYWFTYSNIFPIQTQMGRQSEAAYFI